jgi:hypothetical protein
LVLVDIRTAGIPRDRLRDIAERLAGAPITCLVVVGDTIEQAATNRHSSDDPERLAERRSEIATAARSGKVTLIGALPEVGPEPAFERL